jgi:hypothetical protein
MQVLSKEIGSDSKDAEDEIIEYIKLGKFIRNSNNAELLVLLVMAPLWSAFKERIGLKTELSIPDSITKSKPVTSQMVTSKPSPQFYFIPVKSVRALREKMQKTWMEESGVSGKRKKSISSAQEAIDLARQISADLINAQGQLPLEAMRSLLEAI